MMKRETGRRTNATEAVPPRWQLAWLGIAKQPYTKRLGVNDFLTYLRIKGLSISRLSGAQIHQMRRHIHQEIQIEKHHECKVP